MGTLSWEMNWKKNMMFSFGSHQKPGELFIDTQVLTMTTIQKFPPQARLGSDFNADKFVAKSTGKPVKLKKAIIAVKSSLDFFWERV